MGLSVSKYLSRNIPPKLVLLFDVLLSLVASGIVLLLVYFFVHVTVNYVFAWEYLAFSAVYSLVGFVLLSTYKIIIRRTDLKDVLLFVYAVAIKALLLALTWALIGQFRMASLMTIIPDFILTLMLLLFSRYVLLVIYDVYLRKIRERSIRTRVLVYGVSEPSLSLVTRFRESPQYDIVGFLIPEDARPVQIKSIQLYSYDGKESLTAIVESLGVGAILFATDKDAAANDKLLGLASELGIKVLITSEAQEYSTGLKVRQVKIEDLLEREPIRLSTDKIKEAIKDKVVMVTGAAGSIGSQLCRQLADFGVKKLVLFDNAETPMHQLRLELEDHFPNLSFAPVIGDVRFASRVGFVMRKYAPQIVFHAAAYKHVPLMEENPCEAVGVNTCGTRVLADKCVEYGVEMMVMISTDKAVNPTNVMGCSKRLAEIYVQSLGLHLKEEGKTTTKFVTTRFGNVLGSNGSVIPRFREQIAAGGPVTVTDPRINRFFMTIPEACSLVLEASVMSEGNEIFVFDMGKPVLIDHLARRMIELAGFIPDEDIRIVYTGLRPGEKLYEEVLSDEENTLPTCHERIRIARVREYSYEQAVQDLTQLKLYVKAVDAPSLVKMMKEIVPEYISNNSDFEAFDRK